ncbi:O-antigen polymerase [Acinetobacter sp. ANC 5414]|uniref:O-antigen polymerase n=1 Tax=Acinetobacter sp. ANC 5414 TaxID=2731251 RepID=UPI00149007D4|nr:O-antigen polymerase [Acinetobacter sp. ANC 5414]NNH00066.1 oligosaccharide repeat unit polymerase [Acinetobacter sp. ANC 5414]
MKKIIYFILSFLISVLSFLFYYLFDSYDYFVFGQISVWVITYIITTESLKKIFSLQSLFLLGYGLFILGRFVAQIFYNIPSIYCMDFIFDYCLSSDQILNLNLILYLTLLSFSLPFLFNSEKKSKLSLDVFYSINKIKMLIAVQFFLLVYYSYNSYKAIELASSSGYMALFYGQAEVYETPIAILVFSMIIVIFSILLNNDSSANKLLIKIMFYYFLILMLVGILSGSRASFLTALFMLGYYLYKDVKFGFLKNLLILSLCILIIYFINILAAFSGARPYDNNEIFLQISDTLFGQGITLMVFDASMHVDQYPLLAYLKTILPGIQIFYSLFDIDHRYLFDFSSYLVYVNNKNMYFEGYGLGWSLLSDFYIFSFGFIPLYLLFIYFFSYFLKNIQQVGGSWINGLLFLFASQMFIISRSSISLIILMLILYCLFSIILGNFRIDKNRGV